jgi:hypothetical protein
MRAALSGGVPVTAWRSPPRFLPCIMRRYCRGNQFALCGRQAFTRAKMARLWPLRSFNEIQ